ncbi:hypothetical protein TBLA_0E00320 [Henningerozyma blattae CBS 6284]|uniref:ER membrane protein complex subunit 4 n=1 Tax=Henningerozyma blattae (strain ATCC 34711 / CBS 6284 / DSM 70876 / NBRC 10599 / NRRL Y-10934 / UCD 77-7) TaxID=1071380 RepID=I2H3Z1_HENB6|nr:hypothetical protein TBLA_0E00320 [Tetrapisispora blattae CBS 6284]CCH61093.1 hypothetical protein TBLA_0E00320 [Tetrapisispora blattae CBS 6284]
MMTSKPQQWAVDLTDEKYISQLKINTSTNLPSPPGFKEIPRNNRSLKSGQKDNSKASEEDISSLLVSKAWQIALQPAKSIPMNAIMSYMSGTSLQIIPIMTALMLLSGPIKAIFGIRNAFKPVLGVDNIQSQVIAPIGLYILFQIVLMFIGIHKLNSMGLIPNTKSDWLLWEAPANFSKITAYAF